MSSLHWSSFLVTSVLTRHKPALEAARGEEKGFFFPPEKGQQMKIFCPLKEIGREEGTGFELQKKPAHYREGGCKVQGHRAKEEKKKKAFKDFTASIKAITLLHGTFIAPLQPWQKLFSGAGLKMRPEPVLCHSSTSRQTFFFPMHRHFPAPSSGSEIHFTL